MKMKSFVVKTLSCVLAFSLFALALTGCGKKADEKKTLEDAKKIDKEHIFKSEKIEGFVEEDENICFVDYVNGKVKIIVEKDESDVFRVITANLDGSDVQSVTGTIDKKFFIASGAFDNDGNTYVECIYDDRQADYASESEEAGEDASAEASSGENPDEGKSFSSDEGATTALASTDISSSDTSSTAEASSEAPSDSKEEALKEGQSYIIKYDANGKEVSKADITESITGEDVFGRGIVWSEKSGLLVLTKNGIETYVENTGLGKFIDAKAFGESFSYVGNFAKVSDNSLIISYFDDKKGTDVYCLVDIDSKKVGEPLGGLSENESYVFFGGIEKGLYASDSYGIYKYDSEADKFDKLLDFTDSYIGAGGWAYVYNAIAISDTEIIANIPEDYDQYSNLIRLTKVNPEDVVDKTVITLACLGTGSDISGKIMSFNRANDKYAIKIVDYYELYQDDYEEATKQFNLDITSGKASDIIDVGGLDGSLNKYVNKGIFLDLTDAFKKGGPLGDIEILPNIAEFMKIDGKYYTFIPSFEVCTVSTRAKYADGKTSLTYKDCDELIKSKNIGYDTAFGIYNDRENMSYYLLVANKEKFVDWNAKKCDFNNPEFIELLNFTKNFPEEMKDYGEEGDNPDRYYASDKALFCTTWIYDIEAYIGMKQGIFNDDIELVGFPNAGGDNGALICTTSFAVNSNTEHKDVIYDFIKTLFGTSVNNYFGGFSSVKPEFEAQLQEGTMEKEGDDAYIFDAEFKRVKKKPLSQEEVQKIHDYILSIDKEYIYDNKIMEIVIEEASAFYSGQKTAEEVAEIIQNRVNVYINENS